MSRVFVAEEAQLRRKVVVKVLAPDLAQGLSAERFEREILLTAQLQQANIAPVLAAGKVGTLPYYVMPYVEGQSLRVLLDQGPLPLPDAVGILRDTARALAYAHAHGVIHRDIKPENVLISGGAAVVTDFGIARAVSEARTSHGSERLTTAGGSIGTPAYMSPEQAAADETTSRTDIYSWGVLAYEMLSGAHPFGKGRTMQQLIAAHILEQPPALNRDAVPVPLAALVMRCLEKNPLSRPADGAELLEELTRSAALPAERSRSTRSSRPRALTLALAGALGIVLAIAAFVLLPRLRGNGETGVATVAVLPFANSANDRELEYFADGMTDELTGILATLPGLRVTSRQSSFSFKGKNTSSSDIGRALGVRSLVEGTVRRFGDRVRISAQLTNTEKGVVLWTQTYEREVKDVFAIQDEIAASIASQLELRIGDRRLAEARSGRTANPEAHDQYLRGMFYVRGASDESAVRQSLTHFERAVALDSGYAQAHAAIATAWGLLDPFVPSREVYPRMREAARKSLALDDRNAEAHVYLGYVLFVFDHDFAAAEREFKRALELNGNSVNVLNTYFAYLTIYPERVDEALRYVERAIALDPLSPLHSWFRELGLYLAGRYDEVLEQHRNTRRLDPRFVLIDSWAGAAYREKGMHREALAEYERAEGIIEMPLYGKAMTLSRMGRQDRAREIALSLDSLSRSRHVTPEWIGIAWAAAGDSDRAMRWLERALEEKSNIVVYLNSLSHEFAPLRDDPRFKALKVKVGLP